jgi:hypothetical protein
VEGIHSALDADRLARLLEVGRGLMAELQLEAVLDRLLETAAELTGARYAALAARLQTSPITLTSPIRRLPAAVNAVLVHVKGNGDSVLDLGLLDEAHRELDVDEPLPAQCRPRELAQPGLVHGGRLPVAQQHGRPFGRRVVVVAHGLDEERCRRTADLKGVLVHEFLGR